MALLSRHSNGFQERGCQTLPSATQYKRLLENQPLDQIFWMLFQEARAEAFIKYIPFLFFFLIEILIGRNTTAICFVSLIMGLLAFFP